MQALGNRVRRFLVRHPGTVLVLAVVLITALAVTGTAAAEHSAALDTVDLGGVETTDAGGGSRGPTDP